MSRILLVIDHRENRRLLLEALSSRYDVIIADTDDVFAGDFDLCVFDGPALERLWRQVETRKKTELPIFLPFLLVTARQDVGLATRHLWHSVDELIVTPIERVELQARVEVLLRARQASLFAEHERTRLEAVLQQMPAGIVIADAPSGAVRLSNSQAATLFHPPPQEGASADPYCDFIGLHPDGTPYRPAACPLLRAVEHGEYVSDEEVSIPQADGTPRQVLLRAAPIHDRAGQRIAGVMIATDITAQKETEARLDAQRVALERQAREVTSILESIDTAVMITDREGRILRANTALARMVRRPLPDVLGKTFAELTGITVAVPWRQRAWEHGKTTKRHGVEMIFPFAHERGTTYWDVVVTPILQPDGQVDRVLKAYTEVSEYVIARQIAEEDRARLRTILETLPVGVFIVDTTGEIVSANDAIRRIWGGPIPEVHSVAGYQVFKGWRADTGQPVQPEEWAAARAVRHGSTTFDDEIDIQRFDGTRGTILNSATPLRDETGQITGGIWVMQDITERKQAEEALRESEARYYAFTEASTEGIAIHEHGIILEVNRIIAEHLGYTQEEMVGKMLLQFIAPESREEVMRRMQTGDSGPYEAVSLHQDGTKTIGEIRVRNFIYHDRTVRMVAMRDITALKQAEAERERLLAEVQRSATELDAILTAIVDPVVAYDAAGTVIHANPAMVMLLGRDPVGMACEALTDALAMRYPDGRLIHCEETPAMRALRGEHIVGERLLVTDIDDHEMMIEVSATSLAIADHAWGVVSIWHDITKRERLREEAERKAAELDATLNSIADG
ncbi:MAG TPA: PAS domain S-box protein, partial [Armatimonadota bacterium]